MFKATAARLGGLPPPAGEAGRVGGGGLGGPAHTHWYFTPSMKVFGSGTAPLNEAPEKSNPGFSA